MSDDRTQVYIDALRRQQAPEASNPRPRELLGKYSKYLAEQDSQRAQANLLTAPPPDEAAQSNKLSRQTGVPASLIDGQQGDYVTRLRQQAIAQAAWAHPRIGSFLADPRAAAAAQDDVGTLADLSAIHNRFWDRRPAPPKSWLQRAREFAVNLPGNVGSAMTSGLVGLSRGVTDATKALIDAGEQLDITAPLQRKLFGQTFYNPIQRGLGAYSAYQGRTQQGFAPDYRSMPFVERSLIQGVESVPGSIAALGLTALGLPEAGLGLLGTTTAGQSAREGREAGLSPVGALTYGVSQGGIEIATELTPTLKWLHDTQVGTPFFKRLGKNLVSEQIGEQAATALQDLNQWAAIDVNKGKTFGDYLRERPEAAAQTALAVAATVGTTNIALGAVEKIGDRVVKAADAREQAATLSGIMSTAAKSALRKRDPEHFRQFVEHMADGSPAENVYLPVEAVDTFMQGENFNDESGFFAGIAGQLEEARATGGDVVVPLADVATHLAGTPAWEALKDDARVHAGGWSVKEAIEHGDATQEALNKRGEEIAASVFEQAGRDEPAAQVFEEVRDQLRATGFTADAATKQAQLFAASREAWGARMGMTALEYHRANPVEFRRGTTAAEAAGATTVMDQEPPKALADIEELAASLGAELRVEEDEDDITLQWIKRAKRKKGTGAQIMDALTQYADASGKTITLGVPDVKGRKKLVPYYEDYGFEHDTLSDDYDYIMTRFPDEERFNQSAASLSGLPASSPGPFEPARQAAANYALTSGLPYAPPTAYAKVSEARAKKIATAYEEMADQPDDPVVKAAYAAMVEETLAQWREIKLTGLQVEFVDGEDPYAGNPWGATRDVRENNHLWVFNTDDGYGQAGITPEDEARNPMLQIVKGETWGGRLVRVNDVFRAVHDYFGHIKEGVGFRATGEENAWRMHSAMFSPLARRAMTTETRGQNSWLNYGPHGEHNRKAGVGETIFAEQKIGLLPPWISDEGHADPAASVGETVVKGEDGKPLMVFHGTPKDFEKFATNGKPIWFAEKPTVADRYADARRFRRIGGERIIPAYLDIRNPFDLTTRLPGTGSVENAAAWVEGLGLDASRFTDWIGSYSDHEIYRSKAFGDTLREAGYDGIKSTELGSVTWAALYPGSVRSTIAERGGDPVVLFQSDNPIFYSELARAIDTSKTAKAPAAQWKATLQNAPGVKAEELEWTGLLDALDFDPKAVFTREQLADVVRAGGIVVDEVVMGGEGGGLNQRSQYLYPQVERAVRGASSIDDAVMRLENDGDAYRTLQRGQPELFETDDDGDPINEFWAQTVVEDLFPDGFSATQFAAYSSGQGDDPTYRELLLTLPAGEGNNPDRAPDTHWDQPRVVAHARFSEKTDVDGKRVLFIEEVQSDWHQKGRTRGYEAVADPAAAVAAQAKADELRAAFVAVLEDMGRAGGETFAKIAAERPMRGSVESWLEGDAAIAQRVITGDLNGAWDIRSAIPDYAGWVARYGAARNAYHLAARELDIAKGLITNGGIPNAPFKSTWPQLVTKRLIRWAVDNGFERVAWINGDQQNGGVTDQDEGVAEFYEKIFPKTVQKLIGKYDGKVNVGKLHADRGMFIHPTNPAFNENLGFDITPKLAEAAGSGMPLFQGEARGQIALYPDRSVITLFENSDLSTLLHETGHLFLEELRRNAALPGAPADVKADWATIQKWFAENNVPLTNGAIPRDAHELFARGFERYAMEGKAPSSQLQAAFTAFRSWLLRIYQVVQNLRSPINAEVREVFDRMLATQDAIDSYADEQNAKALTGLDKLMNDAEFDAYQKSVAKARTDAFDALLYRTMERIRVRRQREFNEASRAIRRDATEAVLGEPRFRALRLLRTGKLDDRADIDVKLDHDWLVERYGADILDRLPQGTAIWRKGGTDADEIATMAGFNSGAEMVDALLDVQAQQSAMRAGGDKRQLRAKLIDDATSAAIDAQGLRDPLTDGSLEEEAVAAIENERHGEIIASENRALARRTGTRATPYKLAREWARRKIAAGKVVDVASRSAMQRYARAAAKAARLAESAMLEQNIDEAFRQKQAQLLNHALLTEAKNAADEVDRITARLKKLAARAAMKSVDQDYMDRVHELLERYNFRPASQRWLDEIDSFREWAADQAAKGFEVLVPQRLNDDRQHYSRVSVEELYGLADTVDSLMALGRHKQKLLDAKDERDFADVIKRMLEKMRLLPARKLPKTSVSDDTKRRGVRKLIAGGLKISSIALDLDHQDPNGPMMNLLVHRANDVSLTRTKLREKALQPIADRLAKFSNKQWKRLRELVTIPELTLVAGLAEDDPRLGQPLVLTRIELLGLALNSGNASNFEKMTRGERWSPQAVRAVLDRELSAEDWQFVQAAWDSVETLWPSIVATERQLSGVVPEKVEATPIVNRHGTFAGGYWPVVYDSARSVTAAENEAKAADDMFGQRSGLATAKGHTIARTKAIGPMVYSLEHVLFNHIDKVITRVAYAQYARDVLRVLREPRIAAEIDLRLGREYREEIPLWLADQINVHPDVKPGDWLQWLFRFTRQGTVAVGMGLRFGTGVAQVSGLMAALGRLGGTQSHKLLYHSTKQVLAGVGSMAMGKRSAVHDFVFERSEFMARRLHENTVEVERASKKLQGKHSWKDHITAWMFWHIGMVDLHVVSIPTWITGYRKGIADGMTESQAISYADSMVATSQGSGRTEHLARWQRSRSEGEKLFTMFYTPFNVILNTQWEIARGVKRGDLTKAANLTFFFLIAQMLTDALLSGDWPDDDDDDGMALNATQWVLRNFAFGLFSGVPVARDAAAYGERTITGQYATFGGTPVGRIFEEMTRSGAATYKVWQGDKEFDPKMVPGLANTVGTVTHLPLGQPGQTTKFLWEYQRGDVQPQSIGDWYSGLTKGKVAEKKDETQ